VQKAVVVSQNTSNVKNANMMAGKMICNIASNQMKTIGAMGSTAKKEQSLETPPTLEVKDNSPKEKPKALVSPNGKACYTLIKDFLFKSFNFDQQLLQIQIGQLLKSCHRHIDH
jgi:hypothetical protein